MSREIEFRAWLKKEYYSVLNPENKIYRVENLDFDKNEAYLSECGWYDFDEIELMQYTGLKDKNGVKIFEGDIVKRYYELWSTKGNKIVEEIAIVEYNNDTLQFRFNGFDYDLRIRSNNIEVIGNIYENPELLEA